MKKEKYDLFAEDKNVLKFNDWQGGCFYYKPEKIIIHFFFAHQGLKALWQLDKEKRIILIVIVNSGDADPHSGDVDPPPGGFLFWTAKIGKLSNKLKNYFLFLNDSPFSSILNEPFINLSRIASATVPSPIISYHLFTGN